MPLSRIDLIDNLTGEVLRTVTRDFRTITIRDYLFPGDNHTYNVDTYREVDEHMHSFVDEMERIASYHYNDLRVITTN